MNSLFVSLKGVSVPGNILWRHQSLAAELTLEVIR